MSVSNFVDKPQQQQFFQTFREFAYVLLFLLVCCALGFAFLGFQENRMQQLRCDAEQVRQYKTHQSFYQDGVYFSGGTMQTDEFAHSGTHSMKLTKEDAYGFQYEIPYLKGNERIMVSVWRFGNGKDTRKGIIVAAAPGMWQAGEEVVEKSEDGWEKIQFSFAPPPASRNRTLKIYCWNNSHEPLYFDDFSLDIKLEEPL